jgi:hypothetical protein
MRPSRCVLAVLAVTACADGQSAEPRQVDASSGAAPPVVRDAGEGGSEAGAGEQPLPVEDVVAPAVRGCQLLAVPPVPVTAVADPADAGQVVIRTDSAAPYSITLPQGSSGYLTLEVTEWSTDVVFFAPEGTSYTVAGGSEVHPVRRNPSCAERAIGEYRRNYHHWGPYVVEFAATGPRQVWFATFLP